MFSGTRRRRLCGYAGQSSWGALFFYFSIFSYLLEAKRTGKEKRRNLSVGLQINREKKRKKSGNAEAGDAIMLDYSKL